MGKSKRNKAESQASIEQAAGKSLLDVAWRAYEAGDSVMARRAANLLLAGAGKDADEAVAKRVGKQLFATSVEVDARQVATELVARTKMAPKPYYFALMTAALWLFMVLIANRH
jgi:hypothetical protein